MLNDELNIWQEYFNLFKLNSKGLHETAGLSVTKEVLLADQKRIKAAWLAAVFSEANDLLLSRYFGFHKKRINADLGLVQNYLNTDQIAPELLILAELLKDALMDLDDFIDRYFPDYSGAEARKSRSKSEDKTKSGALGKLSFKLSGAQLACFIKLFCELDLYPSHSIIEVIRFIADHFQTKMRQPISANGLSKEYYSISQKTAATCRDILQKMIQLLDKQFFP